MTRQEAFDKAWLGLKSQGWGKASIVERKGERCVYLTEDGKRCAFGWCLTEEQARTAAGSAYTVCFNQRIPYDEFYTDLQRAHDQSSGPENMQAKLRGVADRYNLTVPE